MVQAKEIAKSGKRMGKKVLATDTAQDVVGVVVDGLEEVAVDKADDVAENVKARAARARGAPRRARRHQVKLAEVPSQETYCQEVRDAEKWREEAGCKEEPDQEAIAQAGRCKEGGDGSKVTDQAGECDEVHGQAERSQEVDSPQEVEREAALIRVRITAPQGAESEASRASRRAIPYTLQKGGR